MAALGAAAAGNHNGIIPVIARIAAMRRFSSTPALADIPMRNGTTPTAAGLAILIAVALWPGLPAVSGMALVALGATQVTLERFRNTAAILPVAILHLATYGGLYTLFVGATLHATTTSSNAMLGIAPFADIALSIIPLGIALELVWGELRGGRVAE